MDLIKLVQSAVWPECRSSRIVFVDGLFCENLSDLSALPSSCAFRLDGDSAIFYIPPMMKIDVPVQIVSMLTIRAPSALRLHILMGPNAHLDMIETTLGEGMMAQHIDIFLDEGAELRFACKIGEMHESHLEYFYRAALQRNARLSSFYYSSGALMLQRDWQVMLYGENSEAELKGIDDLQGKNQAHMRVSLQHLAPHCRSRQHFKKILQGHSRASSEGTITIARAAHGSDANQLCQNLLLSDEAFAVAKPFLDIFADDVAVKHGATFTQPNDEELFYCQSRGMSALEAKELWRQGFCDELIQAIEIPLMRDKI